MSQTALPPFLGLEPAALDEARVAILPVPYEATVSYGKGTAQGPEALLDASQYVELFDELRDREPASEISFFTAAPVNCAVPFEPTMAEIRQRAQELVNPKRLLMSIGGEHSITGPLVAAHLEQFPDLHVLQIDAHCDLRDVYEGSLLSHASAMARVVEQVGSRLTQVGIRSICAEDRAAIRDRGLHTFFAGDLHSKPASVWIDAVVETLGPQVYLTVDVDGLDPSVIPSTGTPEPGGLSWWDTIELVRVLGERRQIVGADMTELAVVGDRAADRISAFAAAKLAYQICTAAIG